MTQITMFQDFIASLDFYLPWLLPALNAFDQAVPATLRLVVCVPLMICLVVLRQRNAAAVGSHP